MESELLYNEISIPEFVNSIFNNPPLDACSYNLFPIENENYSDGNTNDLDKIMFPILMNIMMTGAKILFGENITPQSMSTTQFDILKKYMLSFGYKIEHNYTNVIGKEYINIWFKRISIILDCKGNKVIKFD